MVGREGWKVGLQEGGLLGREGWKAGLQEGGLLLGKD